MIRRIQPPASPFLLLLALALVLVTQGLWAQERRITDIRFWQSPEEAQVVVDLTEFPKVTPMETLPDGTFFFEIDACKFRPGRASYPLNNQFLNAITVQERSTNAVRIYFRVPAGIQYRTFLLPKNQVKPDRIVIFLSEPTQVVEMRRQEEIQEVSRLRADGQVKIVVIDAGHGGEDPGARHNGIIEKNFVLYMAKLVKSIFDKDPRYKAILTRTGDYIIPLERRSQIAENLRADAFVSIHANYNSRRSITGIEVYCESPKGAVGEAERLVAETENQQDYIGAITGPGAGVSRKSQIVQKQAITMFQSQQLAQRVENRMRVAVPGLASRGVKRAGFKVLHSLNLPSILVELGYISNPAEANLLKVQNNQIRLAQSIYLGVRDFLESPPVQGYDASYIAYVQAVEAEKRARAERIRKAQERRARMLANSIQYQVKKGETIAQIASKFKVNPNDLRELNNLSKKSKLKAGQTLRVPRG